MKTTMTPLVPLLVSLLVLSLTTTVAAQEWETTVTYEQPTGVGSPDLLDPSLGPITIAPPAQEAEETPRVISAEELPRTLTFEESAALRQRAADATLRVVATYPQDPLMYPPVVEVWGAATAIVADGGGEPVLLTASFLVEGADSVSIETPDGLVIADVDMDRNAGLAILRPRRPVGQNLVPLSLAEDIDVNTQEEGFTSNSGGGGATMGAGDGEFGYYQINTLGAVLGVPILNRDGEILGIGSHRYPPRPDLTLSIPADRVAEYLSED